MDDNITFNIFDNCRDFLLNFISNNSLYSGFDSFEFNNVSTSSCNLDIPSSSEFFGELPISMLVAAGLISFCNLFTWIVYFEEIYFLIKNFKNVARRNKTIWVLAFAPVFSTTGLLGTFLPRAGPLVDMAANVFFGACLYNFGGLMINYMGGPQKMWEIIGDNRRLEFNTPPLCCCCACLPSKPFTRKIFLVTTAQIMQVAIVRTILMFIAAVLWADGTYRPGDTSLKNGFIYIASLNLISTMLAVYGLMLTRRVLAPELQTLFDITGKIAILQLTLLSSVIPNFIIGILVSNDVIGCGTFLPPRGRGEVLYHILLVFLMVPYSLLARRFYRRAKDGIDYAHDYRKNFLMNTII